MNQTILITGTSSGFGKLIALTSVKKGHTVIATMRGVNEKNKKNAEALLEESEALPGKVHVYDMDVASDDSVNNALKSILSEHSSIDVLINNAGIGGGGLTEGFTVDQFEQIMNVNVLGVHRVVKGVLPSMRNAGKGLIINISSIMGRVIIPFATAYTTSKYALEGYTESLRYELKGFGIDLTSLEPGGFGTNFMGNMIPPSDMAAVDAYGDFKEVPQKMWGSFGEVLSSGNGPDPQQVADAADRLIDMASGQRPVRVVVDPMNGGEAPSAINKMTDEIQKQMLSSFGMAEAF